MNEKKIWKNGKLWQISRSIWQYASLTPEQSFQRVKTFRIHFARRPQEDPSVALFLISLQENYVFTDKMSPSRGTDTQKQPDGQQIYVRSQRRNLIKVFIVKCSPPTFTYSTTTTTTTTIILIKSTDREKEQQKNQNRKESISNGRTLMHISLFPFGSFIFIFARDLLLFV